MHLPVATFTIGMSIFTFGLFAWLAWRQGRRIAAYLMMGVSGLALADTIASVTVMKPPVWILLLEGLYVVGAVIVFMLGMLRPPAAPPPPPPMPVKKRRRS